MVVDGAKGVEDRTIKLMNVCRLRDTPIIGFVNKLDRDIRDAIELLDEIEDVLKIEAAPINWPIGMGKFFKGVYNLYTDTIHCFEQGNGQVLPPDTRIQGLDSDEARALLDDEYDDFCDEIELVRGASHEFDKDRYLAGQQTPSFLERHLVISVFAKCLMISLNGRRNPNIGQHSHAMCHRPKARFPVRFQNPGEYGSEAQRSHCLCARLFRSV